MEDTNGSYQEVVHLYDYYYLLVLCLLLSVSSCWNGREAWRISVLTYGKIVYNSDNYNVLPISSVPVIHRLNILILCLWIIHLLLHASKLTYEAGWLMAFVKLRTVL